MFSNKKRSRRPLVAGLTIAAAAVIAVGASPGAAPASMTFGFQNITNNTSNTGAGLSVTVFSNADVGYGSLGNNEVVFSFHVAPSTSGVISEIYFQDGTLLALSQTNVNNVSVDGVNFVADQVNSTNPGDLPGGAGLTPIPFFKTAMFSADVATNTADGVAAGETTGVLFTLQGSFTAANVIAALQQGASLATVSSSGVDMHGGLRIGIHVRDAQGGVSDSFVNTPTVPEPATIATAITGLVPLGLIALRRRGRRMRPAVAAE